MKKLFTLLFTICYSSFLFAQNAPAIEWQKCFGGSGIDEAYSILQTSDGGFIVVGNSDSNDGDVTGNHADGDWWVVKMDSIGNLNWQKCLGGSFLEYPYSVQETRKGGYVIVGFSDSNDGDVSGNHGRDYWIVKLDSSGNLISQKCLGGTGGEEAFSIQHTDDGGFIIAGYSFSNNGNVTGNHGTLDYWIVKLDELGNFAWQKSLGGSAEDWAYSIQQTNDNGYILAGTSYSNDDDVSRNHGNFDYWIVKLDSIGNLIWQKSYGGYYPDEAQSVHQLADGGYVVGGWTESNDGDVIGDHLRIDGNPSVDYWILRLDATGNILWQKTLGGSLEDYGRCIQQTQDGGFIVTGIANSSDGDVVGSHGGGDYWIVKLDASGNLLWQKTLGGSQFETAYSIQQTSDGGFIVAGGATSTDGDVTGLHGGDHYEDYWIVKLGSDSPTSINILQSTSSFSISTNPFSTTTTLSFSSQQNSHTTIALYDVAGRKLKALLDENVAAGNHEVQLIRGQLGAGVYFLQLKMNGEVVTKKVVVE